MFRLQKLQVFYQDELICDLPKLPTPSLALQIPNQYIDEEDDPRPIWDLIQKDDYALAYPKLRSFHSTFKEKECLECFLYHQKEKVVTLTQNGHRNCSSPHFVQYKGETVLLFNPQHSLLSLINLKGETIANHEFFDLFILAVHRC